MRRIAVVFGIVIMAGAAAAQTAAVPQLAVGEDHGIYTVTASFTVSASPAAALAVLGDYERIPQFAPGVTRSVIKEREGGHVIVEQEAVSRVLLFTRRVHLVLDVEQDASAISFRDICGRSFSRYTGEWQVAPAPGGSTVVYTLTAQPAFDVPPFVLVRLLKRDSVQLLDNLRRAIEAR